MLIQGGVYYFGADITFPSTAWQSVQLTGLTAGDFSSVSATHPDFSTSGGPMQFGFARSNSNNPGNPTIQTHHGIDNWMFTLHTQSAPSIFTVTNTCLLYTSDAADERSSVDLGGRRI